MELPPHVEAVVIGASAGAIAALSILLHGLPKNFPAPIMIVVHIRSDAPSILAELFRAKCLMAVKEAEDKEVIQSGTVYFAPPDYHLQVETNRQLSLSSDDAVLFSRPAIDVLFQSAADAYAETLAGIILTGANEDGAKGLRAVCAAGGTGLVQNPLTAEASMMPAAALRACPNAAALSLEEIRDLLNNFAKRKSV